MTLIDIDHKNLKIKKIEYNIIIKMFFSNNKQLIDWNKKNDIEFYRQKIEQDIINTYLELTLTCLDYKNFGKNDSSKIIIDIGSGYCKWLINFIKTYKKQIYNFSIYSLDNIDILGNYLNNHINIENEIKDEIIELGLYCIYIKKDLKKEKLNFEDESVYFVYQRNMLTVYKIKEWNYTIDEIFRILKKNCAAEFVEYDFMIKNIETESITNKINKYIKNKLKNIDINIILNKINNKFYETKYKSLKLPLYKEDILKGICIENVILGYTHFMDDIIILLKKKYNIILTYNEIVNILTAEWENKKSYIELYFITAKKK